MGEAQVQDRHLSLLLFRLSISSQPTRSSLSSIWAALLERLCRNPVLLFFQWPKVECSAGPVGRTYSSKALLLNGSRDRRPAFARVLDMGVESLCVGGCGDLIRNRNFDFLGKPSM